MLENSRNARESPTKLAIDEQLVHYTGSKSGLKKRMPKKTGEGIEYYTIATSNKDYYGYQAELREASIAGKKGKLIREGDPVAGGYKLNYYMESGKRYEVGTTAPSKAFGIAMLLMFSCGMYLRYQDLCLVTDSAYGFLDGMVFLGLWGISWVTSLRIGQRRGFLGVVEIEKAGGKQMAEQKRKGKSKDEQKKRIFKKDLKT